MTLTMTLENLIELAQQTVDANHYEILNAYTEALPSAPINNGAMVEFTIDQFKQALNDKGITLKVI